MTQRFGKWPKQLENILDTWDTPFNISEAALLC